MKNIRELSPTRFEVRFKWPTGAGEFRRDTFRTLREAQNLVQEFQVSRRNGTWRELKDRLSREILPQYTLSTFWPVFLEKYCKPRMKSWSRYDLSYSTGLKRLGNLDICALDYEHLTSYVKYRSSEVGTATINRDLAALSSCLTFARRLGLIKVNPVVGFDRPKEAEVEKWIPTVDEYQTFIDACKSPMIKAAAIVMGEAALRLGECLRLTWDDLDLAGKRITVSGKSKNGRVRYIPMSDLCYDTLMGISKVRSLQHRQVFISRRTRKPYTNISKIWDRIACRANLPKFDRHCLRHFRITMWLAHGAAPYEVMYLAGHSDLKITLRYTHLIPSLAFASIKKAQASEIAKGEEKRSENAS